jgi:hypothetical protein
VESTVESMGTALCSRGCPSTGNPYHSPEEFFLKHLSAVPAADLVAAAGPEVHTALVAHMKEATRAYVDGYGLVVPQEINVATAST